MKILLISGSPRKNANSKKVIDYAASFLQQRAINMDLFDVYADRLPLMDNESKTFAHPQVVRLKTLANQADGFFICTPEYHSGMSGALKNALDFLNRDHFFQKPVAIAATTGGGKGGINALNNMRTVLRGVSALVTVNQVAIDPQDLSATGILPIVQGRFEMVLEELVELVNKLGREADSKGT